MNNEERIESIVCKMLADYEDDRAINKIDLLNQPDKRAIIDIISKLLKLLYPGYFSDKVYKIYNHKLYNTETGDCQPENHEFPARASNFAAGRTVVLAPGCGGVIQ